MPSKPADDSRPSSRPKSQPMSPGDEAPAGTPGTGEAVCQRCGGTGQIKGQECPECGGTGKVIRGIGGA
jgi:DnaJ-class molecular chaperone